MPPKRYGKSKKIGNRKGKLVSKKKVRGKKTGRSVRKSGRKVRKRTMKGGSEIKNLYYGMDNHDEYNKRLRQIKELTTIKTEIEQKKQEPTIKESLRLKLEEALAKVNKYLKKIESEETEEIPTNIKRTFPMFHNKTFLEKIDKLKKIKDNLDNEPLITNNLIELDTIETSLEAAPLAAAAAAAGNNAATTPPEIPEVACVCWNNNKSVQQLKGSTVPAEEAARQEAAEEARQEEARQEAARQEAAAAAAAARQRAQQPPPPGAGAVPAPEPGPAPPITNNPTIETILEKIKADLLINTEATVSEETVKIQDEIKELIKSNRADYDKLKQIIIEKIQINPNDKYYQKYLLTSDREQGLGKKSRKNKRKNSKNSKRKSKKN